MHLGGRIRMSWKLLGHFAKVFIQNEEVTGRGHRMNRRGIAGVARTGGSTSNRGETTS